MPTGQGLCTSIHAVGRRGPAGHGWLNLLCTTATGQWGAHNNPTGRTSPKVAYAVAGVKGAVQPPAANLQAEVLLGLPNLPTSTAHLLASVPSTGLSGLAGLLASEHLRPCTAAGHGPSCPTAPTGLTHGSGARTTGPHVTLLRALMPTWHGPPTLLAAGGDGVSAVPTARGYNAPPTGTVVTDGV